MSCLSEAVYFAKITNCYDFTLSQVLHFDCLTNNKDII